MNQLLNQIDNIFEEKSPDINKLKNSRDIPFRAILENYEKIVTDITKSVKDIIITASTQHTIYKYHPVVKFNSLLLGKKIIWIDNYFQKIHMGRKEADDYINWRPIDDEKNNLHWGRCFPKGEERYIVIHQDNKVNENKIENIETKDNKNDPSSLTHKKHYVCHFPDFTGLTNDDTVREKIGDIFKKYNGYINKLQGDIYKHFEYDKIKKASPEDVIKYLFEPAVVLGWKSLFTVTHEYAGIEFIGEIEYVPSLYICKEDKINLDDKDEFEILLKIDELYHEATKKLLLLEQEFIHDYLGIAHLPNRVWNTWNDYMEKERFDRFRMLPTSGQGINKEDKEQKAYKAEIKKVLLRIHSHFDDFCKKRNIWLILNYCSLFLTNEADYRLSAIRTPSVNAKVEELEPQRLSWYGIFGTINNNIVLRMSKVSTVEDPVILKEEGHEIIFDEVYRLKIPRGDGVEINDKNGSKNLKRYTEYIDKFKKALTEEQITRGHAPFLHGKKEVEMLKHANNEDVANNLFQTKNMKEWKECLIISSKYLVNYADSLNYFPNILFFKEQAKFTDEDLLFCRMLNVLYVKIVTELLNFENEILLDRLEDLVDSKPQRFFEKNKTEKLSKEVDLDNYKTTVEEIYKNFINNYVCRFHPIIKDDLLIAYYLYRTLYFKDQNDSKHDINLSWINDKKGQIEKNKFINWEENDYKIKADHIRFDFKKFIYDYQGEKTPVEFERKDDKEFIFFVNSLPQPDKIEEFYTIVIGNIDAITENKKDEYHKYLNMRLTEILDDMAVEDKKKRQELIDLIGSGEEPAKYFSLFCMDYIGSTEYKYIYYIPSVNYDGSSYGGFSFFCKSKWARSITKAAQDWSTRFGSAFSKIEAEKLIKRETSKHGTKAAIASIMGRNMSHNIGSHVLSSPGMATADTTHVAEFHSYLQKRMDLLARITGENPDWGEPMFFVDDLLKGFFNQTLLLNNLVADQGGWKEDKIEFIVKIPDLNGDQTEIMFKYCNEAEDPSKSTSPLINRWKPCKKINSTDSWESDYEDFLVSIPDGVIGAQAFYIFMESMLRNSAKYGKDKTVKNSNPFIIHIDVNDMGGHYKLHLWDNLSTCDGKLASDIQEKIKEKLIDDTGTLCSTSLGIAEMRESCKFLIHPHEDDCPAYSLNHGSKTPTNYPLWVECPMPNNCIPDKNGCSHLCYTFNLAKPKMIAIVGKESKSLPVEDNRLGIKKIEKNDLLTKKGAYQFVLFYVNENSKKDVLDFIEKNHRKLPQRLLLVNNEVNVAEEIFQKKRSVFCSTNDIAVKSGDLLISTYKAWIEKRWLNGKKVSLQISFARGENVDQTIYKSWQERGSLGKGLEVLKDIIGHYNVKAKSSETGNLYDVNIVGTDNNEQNGYLEIVYTNHKGITSNGKFFYHNTGVTDKKIFETLASPPKGFMFKYFLLGLIESGLTRIVVIDERATCSLMGTHNTTTAYNDLKDKIHCYPVFYIKNNSASKPLTETIGAKNYYKTKVGLAYNGNVWKIENAGNHNSLNIDFIVFHNGIVETVVKDLGLVINFEELYGLSPSVVITSGRGKVLKDLRDLSYPFLEFSILKDNIFPSVSKYHLVRSLMSTKGKEVGSDEG